MEESAQILTTIKYQRRFLNFFVFVILISFVSRTGKSYYHPVILEECKQFALEKQMPEDITDIFLLFLIEDSDEENSIEENTDKETFDKFSFYFCLVFVLEALRLILGYS